MNYPFPDPRDTQNADDGMNTSSGQDCTGLIPANPDEALDNYDELYDFLPRAVKKDNRQ